MVAGCATGDGPAVFSVAEPVCLNPVCFELAESGAGSVARKTNGASTSTCTSLGLLGGSAEFTDAVTDG